MTLFPVILPVCDATHGLSGKERVARLSRISREALKLSAEKSGVRLGELEKDEDDVPCPFDGVYWSVSHKPKCVAAVVSEETIGIDVEEAKPRPEAIFDLVASHREWELGNGTSWETLFRYWTAKEAALKAVGIGIGGLRKCRVISVPDQNHVVLKYKGRIFRIEQFYYQNHTISLVKDDKEIEWTVADDFSYSCAAGAGNG